MSAPCCPVDGTRLLLVSDTNGQGDAIQRWECSGGDWAGPWFVGDSTGENLIIPEVSRRTQYTAVTGDVTISEPVTTDGTFDHKFKPGTRTPFAVEAALSGDNTIVTPGAGLRLRVHWVGMSSSENNGAEVLAIVKFGAAGSAKYRWNMGAPGAFSHWEPLEGATNEALIVNLSGAQPVQVNLTYESF